MLPTNNAAFVLTKVKNSAIADEFCGPGRPLFKDATAGNKVLADCNGTECEVKFGRVIHYDVILH
jgi:hypothetical protein